MTKFLMKPITVEAIAIADIIAPGFSPDTMPQWLKDGVEAGTVVPTAVDAIDIMSLAGPMRGGPGDWIVYGLEIGLSIVNGAVFAATYEAVSP